MKSILDATFQYRPSLETDVRKTFERLRKAKKAADDKCNACEPWFDASAFGDRTNVCTLKRSKTA